MARPKTLSQTVTTDRAARLCKMLNLLSVSPKARNTLVTRLKTHPRGFYRDVKYLRSRGILVVCESDTYRLDEPIEDARAKLPCPDPELTLSEAAVLCRGNSTAHKKLRKLIDAVAGDDHRHISIL